MVRVRVVLLVTIAAFLAPSIAPCLPVAPSGHAAMPCCRPGKDAVPVARPCCVPADREPAAPPASVASLLDGAPSIAGIPALAPVVASQPFHAGVDAPAPVRSTVPSSVLLI